jgi:ubiquinone/menaquinone biosynthesis C-methylase UbiE
MAAQDKRAEAEFSARQIGERGHSDHLDPQRREKELELLGIAQAQNQLVLDTGCGTGTYGLVLARKGNRVVGIDISSNLVKVARNRADKESLSYFPLVGDIERLPLEDESFDICVCGFILHHLPVIHQTIAEQYRVLKPGGIIGLIEPNGSNPVAKLSDAARRAFLNDMCEGMGYCSANERDYSYTTYLEALSEGGFRQIRFSSHKVARVEPKSRRSHTDSLAKKLLQSLLACRELTFFLAAKVLPQPYKWPTLYITATKPVGRRR